MTTRTHRMVRKIAPFLNKIEPAAISAAYVAAGIMALFSWFYPLKVTENLGAHSTVIEASLLSVGALLGLIGIMWRKSLVEFWGLIACAGGLFITLSSVINVILYDHQYNYGQFLGLIIMALALMFTHGFKLYHDITESWINAPAPLIDAIYNTK